MGLVSCEKWFSFVIMNVLILPFKNTGHLAVYLSHMGQFRVNVQHLPVSMGHLRVNLSSIIMKVQTNLSSIQVVQHLVFQSVLVQHLAVQGVLV